MSGANPVEIKSEAAKVVGQRRPPAGCVSNAPVLGCGVADTPGVQVGGCPAAGELAGVEGTSVRQDTADAFAGFGELSGCGRSRSQGIRAGGHGLGLAIHSTAGQDRVLAGGCRGA